MYRNYYYGNAEEVAKLDQYLREILNQYSQIITKAANDLTLQNRDAGRFDMDFMPLAYEHIAKLEELAMNPNKEAALKDVVEKMEKFMDRHYSSSEVYKEYKQIKKVKQEEIFAIAPNIKIAPNVMKPPRLKGNIPIGLFIIGGFITMGFIIKFAMDD